MTIPLDSPDRWKVHPIYFVAVGFGVGIWFAMTWLAPAQLGNLKYEVEDARRTLPQMTKKFEVANTRIVALKKDLRTARLLYREAQHANLFHSGSPYPVGFSKVRVGDAISNVEKQYPAETIDKSRDRYWTVKVPGSLIDALTYYFDETDKQRTITHISVSLDMISDEVRATEGKDFIVAKLTEILGPPTIERNEFYSWAAPSSEGVFCDCAGSYVTSYLIMKTGYRPAYWPETRHAKQS
jgi:hypothetical protein